MKIVKRKLRRVQKKTGKKRKRASSIMSAKIVSVWKKREKGRAVAWGGDMR